MITPTAGVLFVGLPKDRKLTVNFSINVKKTHFAGAVNICRIMKCGTAKRGRKNKKPDIKVGLFADLEKRYYNRYLMCVCYNDALGILNPDKNTSYVPVVSSVTTTRSGRLFIRPGTLFPRPLLTIIVDDPYV